MTDLEKRILENQEEYNALFILLADKFSRKEKKKSLFQAASNAEIDNLIKSINEVKSNLEVLRDIEKYLEEEERKVYGRY